MSPTVRALNGRRPFRGHTRHLTRGLSNGPPRGAGQMGSQGDEGRGRRTDGEAEGGLAEGHVDGRESARLLRGNPAHTRCSTPRAKAALAHGRRQTGLGETQGDVAPEALCPPRRWPPLPPGSGLSFPDPDSTSPASPDHVVGLFSQKLIESKENSRIPPEHT